MSASPYSLLCRLSLSLILSHLELVCLFFTSMCTSLMCLCIDFEFKFFPHSLHSLYTWAGFTDGKDGAKLLKLLSFVSFLAIILSFSSFTSISLCMVLMCLDIESLWKFLPHAKHCLCFPSIFTGKQCRADLSDFSYVVYFSSCW